MKARNHVAAYTRDELNGGLAVIERLLDVAANGLFFPTDEAGDCRICDFQTVCRALMQEGSRFVSPPADWTRAAMALDELQALRELRGT